MAKTKSFSVTVICEVELTYAVENVASKADAIKEAEAMARAGEMPQEFALLEIVGRLEAGRIPD